MAPAVTPPDPVGMPKTRCRLVSLTRIALLLTTVAVLLASQAATSFAASHAAKPHKSIHASHKSVATKKAHTEGALPEQGIFGGCDLTVSLSTCEQDLLQIHQAGMQVDVVDLTGASLADISTVTSYAQSIGVSIMWEINDPGFWGGDWIGSSAAADWPSFSSACGCTTSPEVLAYMIRFLASLPGTYGYYAADDWTLTSADRAGLTRYVSAIKATDPSHMVMVGSGQGQGTSFYSTGATIGNEIYPETTRSLMPYGSNLAMWQSVQDSITQDQRAATQAGTPSAFILQAFSFGDNLSDGEAVGACTASMSQAQCSNRLQFPAADVQLELRNQALQNAHPKLILWYTYSEASQGNHWADLAGVVKAQYPASATAARAKGTRKASRKHGARRHSVGHTLAA